MPFDTTNKITFDTTGYQKLRKELSRIESLYFIDEVTTISKIHQPRPTQFMFLEALLTKVEAIVAQPPYNPEKSKKAILAFYGALELIKNIAFASKKILDNPPRIGAAIEEFLKKHVDSTEIKPIETQIALDNFLNHEFFGMASSINRNSKNKTKHVEIWNIFDKDIKHEILIEIYTAHCISFCDANTKLIDSLKDSSDAQHTPTPISKIVNYNLNSKIDNWDNSRLVPESIVHTELTSKTKATIGQLPFNRAMQLNIMTKTVELLNSSSFNNDALKSTILIGVMHLVNAHIEQNSYVGQSSESSVVNNAIKRYIESEKNDHSPLDRIHFLQTAYSFISSTVIGTEKSAQLFVFNTKHAYCDIENLEIKNLLKCCQTAILNLRVSSVDILFPPQTTIHSTTQESGWLSGLPNWSIFSTAPKSSTTTNDSKAEKNPNQDENLSMPQTLKP